MASFFQDDLHSSDSEDDDYIPEGEVTSDEDEEEPLPLEHDETETKKRAKKNRKVLKAEGEKDKLFEEQSPVTETQVDEKKRADDLFKNFLAEVETEMKMKEAGDSAYNSPGESSDSSVKREVDGCNLDGSIPEKPSLKIYDFAGETISVSSGGNGTPSMVENGGDSIEKVSYSDLEKSKNSDVNKPGKPADKPVVQRKGLESVLGAIMNKKSKMTTLQKTSLDWNKYKKEHDISEELQNYNRGKGGYIERKRFLERSDFRSYEIERDMRMSKRKKN